MAGICPETTLAERMISISTSKARARVSSR